MRWRKQTRKPTSPNFLFSLPPFIEPGYEIPTIVLYPSESGSFDPLDTPRMQAAVDRLWAVGGGSMRLTAGDYYGNETLYIDDRTEDSRGT